MTVDNDLKKQFLNSYLQAKKDVNRLEVQLQELKLNKLSLSVVNDGMPHSNSISDLSAYAAKVDEIERQIWKARFIRIQAFEEIQAAIEKLDNSFEKDVLTYRYLRGMKWEDICVITGYSWRKVHYLHRDALNHFKICA